MASQQAPVKGFASIAAMNSCLAATPVTATITLDGKVVKQGVSSIPTIDYFTHTPSGHISLLPQIKPIN